MEDYVGNQCPYCKQEIKDSDEVVVCASCEMPHHKRCWNEKPGCSTCGSAEIGSVHGPAAGNTAAPAAGSAPTQPAFVFCPKCGSKNNAADKFCSVCGTPLSVPVPPVQQNPYTAPPPVTPPPVSNVPPSYNTGAPAYSAVPPQYNASNDLEAAYIQTNIGYYKQKFGRMRQTGSKAGWNWAAFFLAPYWLIYRKMFGWGFGVLGAQLVLGLISIISMNSLMSYGASSLVSLLALGISITIGIIGNSLYMQKIDKLVAMGQTMVDPQRAEHIRKNGGTNAAAAVLTAVGHCILYSILISVFVFSTMTSMFGSLPFGSNCAYDGCSNDAVYGDYCFEHVCMYPDCLNGIVAGTYYCAEHQTAYAYCAYAGCYNYAEYGSYCYDHVCMYGDCTNPRVEGSEYCTTHGGTATTAYCAYPGCYNYAEYGSYCYDHVCMYGDCTNPRVEGSEYCTTHSGGTSTTGYCVYPGCYNYAEYGSYCYDHVCIFGDCTNPRVEGTYYCTEHQGATVYCAVDGCPNYAEYGSYCYDHVCMYGDCTNPREVGSEYCYLHQ